MKLEISCEHLHCGHRSLLGIKDSFDKLWCSPRESSESPQGIWKIHHSVCLVKFMLLAIETFAYQWTACPAQNFLTAHLTTPFQVVLAGAVSVFFREFFCTFPIHLFSECLGPQRWAPKWTYFRREFSTILVLLAATSFEFCDKLKIYASELAAVSILNETGGNRFVQNTVNPLNAESIPICKSQLDELFFLM
jgi:hypothetical protein